MKIEIKGYGARWDDRFAPGSFTQEQVDAAIQRGLPVTRDFKRDDVVGTVVSARVDDVGVEVTACLDGLSEEMGRLLASSAQPFAFSATRKSEARGSCWLVAQARVPALGRNSDPADLEAICIHLRIHSPSGVRS